MNFDPHLTAGRRFSMTVAIAVFLYAYSRNALPENLSFLFFGITFPASRFQLDMLFFLLPGYAAFRYFHLAWVQSTPPWQIRNLMKDKKQLPPECFTSDPTPRTSSNDQRLQHACGPSLVLMSGVTSACPRTVNWNWTSPRGGCWSYPVS